jgi:hypothetical protein
MKPRHKEKRYFGMRLHPGWTIKKSTKTVRNIVRASGVPVAYAEATAWFAERMILAGICIATTAFAFGILFHIYISPPIANSEAYSSFALKVAETKAQIIDLTSPLFGKLVKENYEPQIEATSIDLRKQIIAAYLKSKKSPLADDEGALEALANSRNMKMIIAISFVESNFGKHCYYYNCSGIGGSPPNLRKYANYAAWIQDFDNLLETRYKDLPVEKYLGLYVQPGSPNWLYGVKKVLGDFQELGI